MSRRHAKKLRGGQAGRWVQNSGGVPTSTVSAKAFAESQSISMDVDEGGLVINDPAVMAKLARLRERGPESKVALTMQRSNGEKLPASGVVRATGDDPFVIVGVEPDDPANPPDYQVGDVVRKIPGGTPEKLGHVDDLDVTAYPVGEDLLTRIAMGSDPLTPDQRWGTPRMTDDVVRKASVRGDLPLRPGSERRVEAQAHPERWKLAPDHVCPRCGRDVPTEGHKGEHRGALSRTDDNTEICTPCGTDEAYEQAAGALRPQSEWPIPPSVPVPSDLAPPEQVAGHKETWEDVRGGNRAPRQPMPTPKELPDLRLHLMEKWLPDGTFARAIANGDAADTTRLTKPGVSRHERAVASLLDSEFQRKMLSEASLWWVRDEMVDMVTAATKTCPLDLRAVEIELPADQDAGLVMLGKPFIGTDAFNEGQTVAVDILCWGKARAKMGKVPCISLCMYRYFSFDGGLSRKALEDAVTSGAIYDATLQRVIKNASEGKMAAFLTGGAWVYVGRTDWPLSDRVDGFEGFEEEAGLLSDMQKASMIEDRKFFASLCLLVNHKLSEVDEELAPRHVTRRIERDAKKTPDEAREMSKVKIVRLREIKRKKDESAEDHEKRKVEWKARWYSSGHWAWRWVGPRNVEPRARRRVFVSGSIKGPRDLPIVFKETIRVWTR